MIVSILPGLLSLSLVAFVGIETLFSVKGAPIDRMISLYQLIFIFINLPGLFMMSSFWPESLIFASGWRIVFPFVLIFCSWMIWTPILYGMVLVVRRVLKPTFEQIVGDNPIYAPGVER